jgi:hypothetical protein
MKKLIFCLIITSCSISKNTEYANGYEYPIEDIELSSEYINELRINLNQVGIVYKDSL